MKIKLGIHEMTVFVKGQWNNWGCGEVIGDILGYPSYL